MLEINKVDQIKITKTKPWAIYFNYKDEKYLLHEKSEDDIFITLYKKTIVDGETKLQYMSSAYGGMVNLEYFIPRERKKQNLIYSHIDLYDFVAKLVNRSLATSTSTIIAEIINLNNRRKTEVACLEQRAREIRQKLL